MPSALSRRLFLRSALGAGALGLGLAGCGEGTATSLPAGAPADLTGATIRAMVNQPHVLAFTQLLAPAFEREFGGKLETTAVPYDQLTSQQILDV
jgi:multiple sugar transport system substrate-binding protein